MSEKAEETVKTQDLSVFMKIFFKALAQGGVGYIHSLDNPIKIEMESCLMLDGKTIFIPEQNDTQGIKIKLLLEIDNRMLHEVFYNPDKNKDKEENYEK